MLLDVRHDVDNVIYGAIVRAHRILKGRECDCTAVEGQALERCLLALLVPPKLPVLAGCEVPPVLLGSLLPHAAAVLGPEAGCFGGKVVRLLVVLPS
jgi:hypothetical protein